MPEGSLDSSPAATIQIPINPKEQGLVVYEVDKIAEKYSFNRRVLDSDKFELGKDISIAYGARNYLYFHLWEKPGRKYLFISFFTHNKNEVLKPLVNEMNNQLSEQWDVKTEFNENNYEKKYVIWFQKYWHGV